MFTGSLILPLSEKGRARTQVSLESETVVCPACAEGDGHWSSLDNLQWMPLVCRSESRAQTFAHWQQTSGEASSGWPLHNRQLWMWAGFFANRSPEGWMYFIVCCDLVMAPTGTEKEGPELQKGQVLVVSRWDLHHQPCHVSVTGTMLMWLSLTFIWVVQWEIWAEEQQTTEPGRRIPNSRLYSV